MKGYGRLGIAALLGVAVTVTAGLVVLGNLPSLRRLVAPPPFRVVTVLEDGRWPRKRGGPTHLVTGDFDGDGREDVLVVGGLVGRGAGFRSPFFLLRGDAHRVVSLPVTGVGPLLAEVPPQSRIRSVAAGDIDGDGRADLVVAYDGATAVFLGGQGPTGLGLRFAGFVGGATPLAGASVTVADVDGHGRDAIVSFDPASRQVRLWRRTEGGSFTAETLLTTEIPGRVTGSVAAADIDGDGRVDVAAVAGSFLEAQAVVLHNAGHGHFVPGGQLPLTGPLPAGADIRGHTLLLAPILGTRPDLLCLTQRFGRLNARGVTFLDLFPNPGPRPAGAPAFDAARRMLDIQPVPGLDAGLAAGRIGADRRPAVVGFDTDRIWTYTPSHRPWILDDRDGADFAGQFRDAVIADLDGPGTGRLVVLAVGKRIGHRPNGVYLLVFDPGILGRPAAPRFRLRRGGVGATARARPPPGRGPSGH